MKNQFFCYLILLIVLGTLLPAHGQDSASFTPPQIVKEIVIKENNTINIQNLKL